MKRTPLLATLALVALSPAVALAAPGKTRTLDFSYSGAVGITTPAASAALKCQAGMNACWDFTTVKGEKSVAITATDSTGTPAPIQVYTGGDYAGTVHTFCGSATIDISPKAANAISVRPAVDPVCAGVATSGTIKAVITTK